MTAPLHKAKIPIRIDGRYQKQLIARGLPRDILRARPFDLPQYVSTFSSQVEGLRVRRVQKQVQLSKFEALSANPLSQPYVYIVSSSPNDGKAKQVAMYLMQRALMAVAAGNIPRSAIGRQAPLWHTITGSWNDVLRDRPQEHSPGMLVLSNVTNLSTNVKLEKLRDLLELYNSVPRIIVISGEDPLTFANTKLLLPVNGVLNLSTAKKMTI